MSHSEKNTILKNHNQTCYLKSFSTDGTSTPKSETLESETGIIDPGVNDTTIVDTGIRDTGLVDNAQQSDEVRLGWVFSS